MRVIALFLLLISVSLIALSQDKVLHITEEFQLGSAKSVVIDNKKSVAMKIVPWNNSMIKVAVECDTSAIYPNGDVNKLSTYEFKIKRSRGRLMVYSDPFNYIRGSSDSFANSYRINVSIYFPKQTNLVILNSGHADISLSGDAEQVEVNMNGGSLQTKGISTLVLNSVFSEISLGTIVEGAINIKGGQLSIHKIDELAINSQYTQPKIGEANAISMVSVSDHYTIREVGTLIGKKVFGSCHIEVAKGKIDLKGTSIGLQIADIRPEVGLVRIKTVNDSLLLHVGKLVNYSVNVDAEGQSEFSLTEAIRNGSPNANASSFETSRATKFTSTVGDMKQRHTVFDISGFGIVINFK